MKMRRDLSSSLVSEIEVLIPHDKVQIFCITQTTQGYVICDGENEIVYFTDPNGHILSTSTCQGQRCADSTSWGQTLIADIYDDAKSLMRVGNSLDMFVTTMAGSPTHITYTLKKQGDASILAVDFKII